MRIKDEKELLDPAVRAQIIQEISQQENKFRKDRAYKRYQCFKDKTNRYVAQELLNQFDLTTVLEMRYAIANISIVRKIVDKLSRVYSNGVQREVTGNEQATKTVQDLSKILCLDAEMKKTNRFVKLQKNTAFYLKPVPEGDKWSIKLEPMNPYLYDVVEGYYDRTKPLCYILSNYKPPVEVWSQLEIPNRATSVQTVPEGNRQDEKIADSPIDQGANEAPTFIFWSDSYHFTCNEKGEVIPNPENPGNENPFGEMPIVNFAIDQDGSFWAQGGEDLIDGGVLLNSMITQINHVGVIQGYGQFYMTGENLPRAIKVGPSKAIIVEYKKDEQAEPKLGFLSANPQLQDLRGLVEAYIALLLTTNNLSTSGIATNLQGGVTAPSGIALIIDKAESLEDVQDQRQLFLDREPEIFCVLQKMLAYYGSNICDDLAGLQLPEDIEETISIKFNEPTPIMTEKEKLDNMKLRMELGLDNMITLLMKDDPTLSEKDAETKLMKLIEQEIKVKSEQMKQSEAAGLSTYDTQNPQDPNAPGANGNPQGGKNEGNKNPDNGLGNNGNN